METTCRMEDLIIHILVRAKRMNAPVQYAVA